MNKGIRLLIALAMVVGVLLTVSVPAGAAGPDWSDNFNGGAQQTWVVVDMGDNSTHVFQNDRYELHTESESGDAKALASYVDVTAGNYMMMGRVQQMASEDHFLAYLMARAHPANMNAYLMGISSNGTHYWFGKLVAGVYQDVTPSYIEPASFNVADTTVKFAVFGNTLVGKVWTTGTTEPDHWMIKATDTSYTSGVGGVMIATYPTFDWDVVQAAFDDVSLSTPSEVWVDDDWAGKNPGDIVGGHTYGYDAFAKIQDGINAVASGGTVHVAAGTYVEQVEVTKNLTLQGVGSSTVIQSPDALSKYFTTGSNNNKPVVYVHDADNVTIQNLMVDGAGKGNANYRFIGIGYYNAGGTVAEVEIKDVRDTPWSGAQHGVALYAYNADGSPRTLTVTNSNIHDFQKNGMALNGTGLMVNVSGNTVTGYGPTNVTAQNCIQVGWGASGTVSGNTVSDVSWLGPTWTAATILVLDSNADVTNNDVTNGQTGIYFWGGSGTISGNDVSGSDTGIGREDFYGIIAGDPPMALPSPFDETDVSAAGVRAMADLTINVTDNTITGSGGDTSEGLEIAGGYDDDNVSLTATDNTITGWGYGVTVYKCTSDCGTGTFTSLALHQNSISGNSQYGMYVDGMTSDVDAELNWWGAADGPGPVGPGSGDKVSANVDYSPWLGNYPSTPGSNTYYVDNTSDPDDINALIDTMSAGDTLVLRAGTYTGGITLDKAGITIMGEDGTIIGPGSHGITVSADDVTIEGITLDGTGGDPGDCGIYVNAGVQRLWVRDCEIRNWPADGMYFAGAVTGLKVVDNYVHENGSDGIEFTATPSGTVQVYGNAFRSNTAYGINNGGATSVIAEYNEWGDIDGPTGTNGDGVSGSVDYDPWVFGKLYVDAPATVREGENFTAYIKTDTHHLYGVQFDLTFDPTKLQVVSLADGDFKASGESVKTYDNVAGTVHYHYSRQAPDAEYDATGGVILGITFQAQDISGSSQSATIDLQDASVRLGAKGGINIYVDSVTDDSVLILGTTTVSGVVDLQGRDNDSGAVVDPEPGQTYGYDPAPYTTGAWGTYSFANMTDDTYKFTVEMTRYLDAYKDVVVGGETLDLGTVKLLGGDADDSDTIDISDLTIIGGQFGKSGSDITDPRADINADNMVDILDLVLAAGNYDLSSPVPWA
ncbi:MAG: right-handed parallel beta-helix repeat-containing protein [Chloroflexi bacterium]|nr:right-handed parallel beta-helix repeat-containing protein [Chloroflexota bacterium]